jgi:hypothetical protein
MTRPIRSSAVALAVACLIVGCQTPRKLAPGELAPYPIKGQVIQTLSNFDNPEGVIFSLDERFVFVSNAAEQGMKDKGFGFTVGAGYISKLSFGPTGMLKIVEPKLVKGLTSPRGMAVLPAKTGKFPKGTVFVCSGGAVIAGPSGDPIKDPAKLEPKLVGFTSDGKVVGEIKLGAGTEFAKVSGAPVLFPNAAGFDGDGNLYFSDSGNGGDQFTPAIEAHPGVYMIPYSLLDAVAEGKGPPKPVRFIAIPDGPNGIEVGPNWEVNVCTLAKDPAIGGAMYAIPRDNFETGKLPSPMHKGLDRLDGLVFLGRTRIDSTIGKLKQIVVTPAGGQPMKLVLDPPTELAGPADHAVARADDGTYILVVPDPHWMSSPGGSDPVLVIRLPANFEGR